MAVSLANGLGSAMAGVRRVAQRAASRPDGEANAGSQARAAASGLLSPLQPAAIRIERSTGGGRRQRSRQTAVTLWFGSGPALPPPTLLQQPALRGAVRVGAGLLGAAAMAALAVVAEQRRALPAASRTAAIEPAQDRISLSETAPADVSVAAQN